MSNQLDLFDLMEDLTDSELFGAHYEDILCDEDSTSFENPLSKDIENMYNKVIAGNYTLSDFQSQAVREIFNQFKNIRIEIDPNRIKPFGFFLNGDEELVMWRDEPELLVNLVIDAEDMVTLSKVRVNKESSLEFFEGEVDYEHLAYSFLAK